MENNLFEILIFLFIGFSIIQSLLKKKKEEAQKRDNMEREEPPEEYASYHETPHQPQEESQSTEIGDEFEDWRLGGENYSEAKSKTSEYENWYQTAKAPSDFDSRYQPGKDLSESKIEADLKKYEKYNTTEYDPSDYEKKKLSSLYTGDTKTTALDKPPQKKESLKKIRRVKNIRRKLKEPENLKEYITFNEILGKPKALRE